MESKFKAYLGDSVYVDLERDMIKLTTENGRGATNVIFLEPQVVRSFIQWLEALKHNPEVAKQFNPEG